MCVCVCVRESVCMCVQGFCLNSPNHLIKSKKRLQFWHALRHTTQALCSSRYPLFLSSFFKRFFFFFIFFILISVQFKMVSMCVEKHVHAPPCLSEVSTALPLKQSRVRLIDDISLSSFHGRLSSLSTHLLQVIDSVMSLAVCPLVVSQAPQHLRSSEMVAFPTWLSAQSFPV